MLDLLFTTALAEGAAPAATPEQMQGGGLFTIMYLVVFVAIIYFMMIRPQKKQEKKQKAMLASLQMGDKVVTVGGICGKITRLKDDVVFIETGSVGNPAERSILKIERAAIKTVQTIHDDQA